MGKKEDLRFDPTNPLKPKIFKNIFLREHFEKSKSTSRDSTPQFSPKANPKDVFQTCLKIPDCCFTAIGRIYILSREEILFVRFGHFAGKPLM